MPKTPSVIPPADDKAFLDLSALPRGLAFEAGTLIDRHAAAVRVRSEDVARGEAEAAEPDHAALDLSGMTLRQAFEAGRAVERVLADLSSSLLQSEVSNG